MPNVIQPNTGICVISKATDGVIAIVEARFNPEFHIKLESPHGDSWPLGVPPVTPSRDIVTILGEKKTKKVKVEEPEDEEEVEAEEVAPVKKAPAKKGGKGKGKK